MIVDRMSTASFFFILARLSYLKIEDEETRNLYVTLYSGLFMSDFVAHWL